MTLKLVNAFLKQHRKELKLKGYSKMSYLEKLNYLKEKTKGTKYEREISKFTKPRVDEGIKKVLDKSGRGQNVRVKREKKARPPKPAKKIPKKQAQKIKSMKPKLDKDLFLEGLNIMTQRAKGLKSENDLYEQEINKLGLNQLRSIVKKQYEKVNKGQTLRGLNKTFRNVIIKEVLKDKKTYPLSIFQVKPKKDPKQKYFFVINVMGLYDDEDAPDPPFLQDLDWKEERSSESGNTLFTTNATEEEIRDWRRSYGEDLKEYSDLYTETKNTRQYFWEGL